MKEHYQWIYGSHAVTEVLKNKNRKVVRIAILSSQQNSHNESIALAKKRGIRLELVNKNFFTDTLGKDVVHQGIAVYASPLTKYFMEDLLNDADDMCQILILDHISDVQNIGAILRSSAVFNCKGIILSQNASPSPSAIMAKIASGGIEHVPLIYVTNISQAMKQLKEHGFWCIGMDERADEMIHQADLRRKCAFVIGSEGEGMRRLTHEMCDFCVKIPCSAQFQTMNASHATSIALYEFTRQNSCN